MDHAKQVLLEEGRAPAFLVVLEGQRFAPSERLKRGAAEKMGSVMVLILDAHTGARLGLEIGGNLTAPDVAALPEHASYVAAAESTVARAASHPEQRPVNGSVEGTVKGAREVVLFHGQGIAARALPRRGRFRIAHVREGRYEIAGRRRTGGYCRRHSVTVLVHQATHVAVRCSP
jgi:hypothetical protein